MNLKSIPTDNLYKFITPFCIALMFTSAYATVSVYDSHRGQYEKIKEKEFNLFSLDEKSKQFIAQKEYIRQEFSRVKSDKSFFMSILMTTVLLSIIGALIGFRLWKKNLQVYLDKQVKLETELLQKELTK